MRYPHLFLLHSPVGCGMCPGLGGWASQDAMPYSLCLGEPVAQPPPLWNARSQAKWAAKPTCRASSQLQGWRQSSLAAWTCCSELGAPCAPAPALCSDSSHLGRSEVSQVLPTVRFLKLRGQNLMVLPSPLPMCLLMGTKS